MISNPCTAEGRGGSNSALVTAEEEALIRPESRAGKFQAGWQGSPNRA